MPIKEVIQPSIGRYAWFDELHKLAAYLVRYAQLATLHAVPVYCRRTVVFLSHSAARKLRSDTDQFLHEQRPYHLPILHRTPPKAFPTSLMNFAM